MRADVRGHPLVLPVGARVLTSALRYVNFAVETHPKTLPVDSKPFNSEVRDLYYNYRRESCTTTGFMRDVNVPSCKHAHSGCGWLKQ